ncbi:uncharacterized protein E0L32_002388 [Thyridium curvatum]|uniref:Methyltransferase type 11 domain-containing protein n=1 Tax=Thyridium curvatum TaxID=1093900 RepID=A0A507AEP5_9PEZI|nr:uncharacterized protein E0L32_002388 [Thyridium curvatum]TPX06892.1 hypothetical protein E0L32_002388 [Thyridium curvatum]
MATASAPLTTHLQNFVVPWIFLLQSLLSLPPLILHLLLTLNLATLLSPSRLKYAWFSRFWEKFAPSVRLNSEARVVPLLQGRVSRGAVVDRPAHPPVSGTVIEIGPGSGMWVSLFSEDYLDKDSADGGGSTPRRATRSSSSSSSKPPSVTRVFGVEPNPDVHAALRRRVAAAGLSDTYEVVPTGIEDLAPSGRVPRESVDCVVSILCLCGIPDPQHNVREVYRLLKPGGRWYAYEHVRCTHSWYMRAYQKEREGERERERTKLIHPSSSAPLKGLINLFWPHFLGGCELDRDTGRSLREAGTWSKIDLEPCVDEDWSSPIPHIIGVLTK